MQDIALCFMHTRIPRKQRESPQGNGTIKLIKFLDDIDYRD